MNILFLHCVVLQHLRDSTVRSPMVELEGKDFAKHLQDLRLAHGRGEGVKKKIEEIKKRLIAAVLDRKEQVYFPQEEFSEFSATERGQIFETLKPLVFQEKLVLPPHSCDKDCYDCGCPQNRLTHKCDSGCYTVGCPSLVELVPVGWFVKLP